VEREGLFLQLLGVLLVALLQGGELRGDAATALRGLRNGDADGDQHGTHGERDEHDRAGGGDDRAERGEGGCREHEDRSDGWEIEGVHGCSQPKRQTDADRRNRLAARLVGAGARAARQAAARGRPGARERTWPRASGWEASGRCPSSTAWRRARRPTVMWRGEPASVARTSAMIAAPSAPTSARAPSVASIVPGP